MDFKISLVVKNVTAGDVRPLVDYLNEQGPEYDAALGEYDLTVWQRNNETRQWFYNDDFEDLANVKRTA